MEWFKFRMNWRKPLQMLTDEEAGRVVKALLAYAYTEEEQTTGGREDLLLCQMTEALQEDMAQMKQKAEQKAELSRKRSAAGRKGALAKQAKTAGAGGSGPVPALAELRRTLPEDAGVCRGLPDKNKNTEIRETEERETDTDPDGEISSCSGPPVVEIPLNDGSLFPLCRADLEEFVSLYPAVDILQELRNIRGWCLANETRRKTRRGVRRFINGWLSRAQDRGGKQREPPENPFLAYALGEKEFGDTAL